MPDDDTPSQAEVNDRLRQASKRFQTLKERRTPSFPMRSSSIGSTTPAFTPHKLCYTIEDTARQLTVAFSLYLAPKSSAKVTLPEKTDAS